MSAKNYENQWSKYKVTNEDSGLFLRHTI